MCKDTNDTDKKCNGKCNCVKAVVPLSIGNIPIIEEGSTQLELNLTDCCNGSCDSCSCSKG